VAPAFANPWRALCTRAQRRAARRTSMLARQNSVCSHAHCVCGRAWGVCCGQGCSIWVCVHVSGNAWNIRCMHEALPLASTSTPTWPRSVAGSKAPALPLSPAASEPCCLSTFAARQRIRRPRHAPCTMHHAPCTMHPSYTHAWPHARGNQHSWLADQWPAASLAGASVARGIIGRQHHVPWRACCTPPCTPALLPHTACPLSTHHALLPLPAHDAPPPAFATLVQVLKAAEAEGWRAMMMLFGRQDLLPKEDPADHLKQGVVHAFCKRLAAEGGRWGRGVYIRA